MRHTDEDGSDTDTDYYSSVTTTSQFQDTRHIQLKQLEKQHYRFEIPPSQPSHGLHVMSRDSHATSRQDSSGYYENESSWKISPLHKRFPIPGHPRPTPETFFEQQRTGDWSLYISLAISLGIVIIVLLAVFFLMRKLRSTPKPVEPEPDFDVRSLPPLYDDVVSVNGRRTFLDVQLRPERCESFSQDRVRHVSSTSNSGTPPPAYESLFGWLRASLSRSRSRSRKCSGSNSVDQRSTVAVVLVPLQRNNCTAAASGDSSLTTADTAVSNVVVTDECADISMPYSGTDSLDRVEVLK